MDPVTAHTLDFVNVMHPSDIKDEKTQLRIRRLVMKEVGKSRRKPKTKRERNQIALEVRNATESGMKIDRLGSSKIDPFGPYPIELDNTTKVLVANSECIFAI